MPASYLLRCREQELAGMVRSYMGRLTDPSEGQYTSRR